MVGPRHATPRYLLAPCPVRPFLFARCQAAGSARVRALLASSVRVRLVHTYTTATDLAVSMRLAGCGRPTSGGQYRDLVPLGHNNFFVTFDVSMTPSIDRFCRESHLEIMPFPNSRPQQRGERE